ETQVKEMVVGGKIDKTEYEKICGDVVKARQRSLTVEERWDIVRLQAQLRYERERDKSAGIVVDKTPVSDRVAVLLGRSSKTCTLVWSEYIKNGSVSSVPPPANRHVRANRISNDADVESGVQKFVRDRRLTRTRTVAKDLMAYLLENGHLS
ncbi:unnamed protein product, partial [Aphanomyces euteiches]